MERRNKIKGIERMRKSMNEIKKLKRYKYLIKRIGIYYYRMEIERVDKFYKKVIKKIL